MWAQANSKVFIVWKSVVNVIDMQTIPFNFRTMFG